MHSEVARAIAQEIRITLTPQDETRLASTRPVNPEAHEAFLKGRYHWNQFTTEGLQRATAYFQEAIDKDPNYALAHAGLARAWQIRGSQWGGDLPPMEAFPRAKNALEQALKLDDTLGEAHATLGHIRFRFDWDWAGAEREFKRGIELSPNSAYAHGSYANFLRWDARFDQAIARGERHIALDPLSPLAYAELSLAYFEANQPDQAREKVLAAFELNPNFPLAYFVLALEKVVNGNLEEAIELLEKARSQPGNLKVNLARLGQFYAATGDRAEALKILDELLQTPKNPFSIAETYAALGDETKAIEWLERAFRERSPHLPWVNRYRAKELPDFFQVTPPLWTLRSDPRFQDLLRRMNFPE